MFRLRDIPSRIFFDQYDIRCVQPQEQYAEILPGSKYSDDDLRSNAIRTTGVHLDEVV